MRGRRQSTRQSTRRWSWAMVMTLVLGACKDNGSARDASTNAPSVPGRMSVATRGQVAIADPDVAARGNGVPKGYIAWLDQPSARLSDILYQEDGSGRWEVRTGTAHILYSLKDTTRKAYTTSATFEQLEKPAHPEAYGVFIGGSALGGPGAPRYTYFLVRGDGKYMVKVRRGATVQTITDWTRHSAIPQEDSVGRAVYGIKIDVDGKTAKMSVNGKPVTVISVKNAPLEGVTGVRINHNLHILVTPVSVVRTR